MDLPRAENCVPSDSELMQRLRGGASAAFDQLYFRHKQAVFAYVWRMSADEGLAADLTQETFLRLWEIRQEWTGDGSVRSYLMRVAHGLLVDARRRAAVRDRLGDQLRRHLYGEVATPEVVYDRKRIAAQLAVAIAALSPRTREVFALRRDAGLSFHEIGSLLGISPRTAEVHMRRALSALRRSLSDLRAERGGGAA